MKSWQRSEDLDDTNHLPSAEAIVVTVLFFSWFLCNQVKHASFIFIILQYGKLHNTATVQQQTVWLRIKHCDFCPTTSMAVVPQLDSCLLRSFPATYNRQSESPQYKMYCWESRVPLIRHVGDRDDDNRTDSIRYFHVWVSPLLWTL